VRFVTYASKFCTPLDLKQSDYLPEGAFCQYLKSRRLAQPSLKEAVWLGRATRSTATPLEMGSWWGRCICFTHRTFLGPTIHVYDDVEWGPDATSNGGGTFTEAVRCPFETFWRCGADGGVSVEEPSRESSSRLPVAGILVRCEAPQCGWWGTIVDFFAIGGTLRAIPFQEVCEGGVGRD
jgi:hypothetical protein